MKKSKKILIIDNSMEFRLFARIRLEMSKYEVFEAENGEKGFLLAKKIIPDLILMDFSLPDHENGFEIVSKLRSQFETSKIQVILLSYFPLGKNTHKKLKDLKITDHIINPYEIELLFEKIRDVFGEDSLKGNTKTGGDERREYSRFTTFNFAPVEIPSGKRLARIKNISKNGISLMLPEGTKIGNPLKITFRKQSDEFIGMGKVRWIQREKVPGGVLAGAEIETLSF